MQSTATKKFNNIRPHVSAPLSFFKKGYPLGTAILGGLFYSFSGKLEKDGSTSTCTRRKQVMASELNLSSSTVWRGMKTLKKEYVSEVEGKYDTYVFDRSKIRDEQFVRIPKELRTKEYSIIYKKRKNRPERSETRYLKLSEVVVGGWIITQCDNMKKNKKEFETSNSEIAEALGLSEPTVQSAIDTLIGAKIVFRDSKHRGLNRYHKSKYHVHRKFLRSKKKEEEQKPEQLSEAKTKTIVHKNEADVRAEQIAARERRYYDEKHLAEEIAERNYKRAMQDERFREAELEIQAMGYDLAVAEELNSPELVELQKKYKKYKEQRDDALKRLGMTDNDFQVRCDE